MTPDAPRVDTRGAAPAARKAKVVATSEVVEVSIPFDTPGEADQFVASAPKSLRLKRLRYANGHTDILMRADLRVSGANGGANETGIKRYQSFLRAAEKLGVEIDHQMPYGNSISADELAAQIGRGGTAIATSVDELPDHAIVALHKAALSPDEMVGTDGSTFDSLHRLGLVDARGKLTEDGAILQAERIRGINLRSIEGAVKGDMVTHSKLGDGLILNISPVGEVQVRFRDGSTQWVDGRDLSDLQRRADSMKPVEQLRREGWGRQVSDRLPGGNTPRLDRVGATEAVRLADGISGDDDRSEYMRRALRDADEIGAHVYVVRDRDGGVVGAVSMVQYDGEDESTGPYSKIEHLGAVAGNGRRLVQHVAQLAYRRWDAGLVAETTGGSDAWWSRMGATEDPLGVGSSFVGWDREGLRRLLDS